MSFRVEPMFALMVNYRSELLMNFSVIVCERI